ncbi:MAG: hypothetical protein ACRDL6_01345 [Solirubrobacterales bacterium]
MADQLLQTYLRDHMAGARAGVELARRAAGSNRDSEYGAALAELSDEIEGDRRTLAELMDRLGVHGNPVKEVGGVLAERLGRLKLNGRLLGYSPLSRLLEIEGLAIGVSGKLELWRSLRAALDSGAALEGIDLDRLIERAESQRARLESLHERAARDALDSA